MRHPGACSDDHNEGRMWMPLLGDVGAICSRRPRTASSPSASLMNSRRNSGA